MREVTHLSRKKKLGEEQVLRLIREKIDQPASVSELFQILKVPRARRQTFMRRISKLIEKGALIKTRGNRYCLPNETKQVTGRVEVNSRGFGFVIQDGPMEKRGPDIYVSGINLKDAMHGDRVIVSVERSSSDRTKGRVMRLLQRAVTTLVGRYDTDENDNAFVIPFDRRFDVTVEISHGGRGGARSGQMVDVELIGGPTESRKAAGRIIEVIGDINAAGVDTQLIIRKHKIAMAHSSRAADEVRELGNIVGSKDLCGRTDFRSLQTITIDGDNSRDFDDAITVERLRTGNYWLGVHIADVSHYVKEGGALDAEAYARGTSVYFPDQAVHMFPEAFATGLCSLNPNVDRLVQSCLMEITQEGIVVRYEIHEGVIRSDARMTYAEVEQILVNHEPETCGRYETIVPLLDLSEKLFYVLNERRSRRGAIDFDFKEAEIIISESGCVEQIVGVKRTRAHQIVEEFMLVANETVACHLEKLGVPSLYRVHEDPDPSKVIELEEFLSALGYRLTTSGNSPKPMDFRQLLKRLQGKPEEKTVALLILRTMQKARYAVTNLGHFGLASASYTHFTSPIRRYPDLLVHRILRECRMGFMDETRRQELKEQLPETARHASERERRAEEAERELIEWKKVRFMADKVGDEFAGHVTGVTRFGLFVELIEHFVEGLVHVTTMADDYYQFFSREQLLMGETTKKIYRLGDPVRVQVIRVEEGPPQLELGLVDVLARLRTSERVGEHGRSSVRSKGKNLKSNDRFRHHARKRRQ